MKTIFNFLINPLFLIILLGLGLRLYGINWDSGFHFHPDERMLIMVAERLQFWTNLNPDFFNYGSLPIYILKGASQLLDFLFKSDFSTYDGMLIVGRLLSTLADLGVLILIFQISQFIFQSKKIALWSIFFYAVAFFPIQNSHFFIVDTFLNLFSTLLIYLLLCFNKRPSNRTLIMIGVTFAATITTKISAIIFLPIILFAVIFPQYNKETIFQKFIHFIQRKLSAQKFLLTALSSANIIIIRVLIFGIIALLFSFIFMPYAFIESGRFISDISQQVQMNSDAYIFPYTLQYVGTLPYWYYVKNIFLWGLGPVISILAIVGFVAVLKFSVLNSQFSINIKNLIFNKKIGFFESLKLITVNSIKIENSKLKIIFLIFYLLYFAIIGRSAVKFMRYLLLMYPFFAIIAGYGADVILNFVQNRTIHVIPSGVEGSTFISRFRIPPIRRTGKSGMTMIIILLTLLWTFMFVNIYSTPNTRIQATKWINQYIPQGSTLAVEHWDDRVPIHDPGQYQYEELTLYDIPDDDQKWKIINQKIDRSDYIVIASNRLYAPLQRLDNCEKTFPRCYPLTSQYFQKLFNNELGFVKVAEFTSYPRLKIGNWKLEIDDSSSDESFTVYDHPKIMIFKKVQ